MDKETLANERTQARMNEIKTMIRWKQLVQIYAKHPIQMMLNVVNVDILFSLPFSRFDDVNNPWMKSIW